MKSKKIYFIVVGILLLILSIIIWSYFNREEEVINNPKEFTPSEEISDEQLRNTIISLYFIDKETGDIKSESKLIDAKILLENPYEKIINYWLAGPTNENLKNNCSKNIKINNISLIDDCVVIDFSREFISEYSGKEGEDIKIINCLVNTLTELTEVNCIKILINGEENNYLGNFNLSEKYYKIN